MLGEAIGMFRHDLLKYEDEVNKAVKVPLKQYEFDAIVSWHYNTGAVATASWIKKLNAGPGRGAQGDHGLAQTARNHPAPHG